MEVCSKTTALEFAHPSPEYKFFPKLRRLLSPALPWHESFFQRCDNKGSTTSSRIVFYSTEHKSCSTEHHRNAGKTASVPPGTQIRFRRNTCEMQAKPSFRPVSRSLIIILLKEREAFLKGHF